MKTQIITLDNGPEYLTPVISLVEKEFGYTKQFHFDVDFYPLLEKSNHKNCYLLINQNNRELIGHIGVCVKKLEIDGENFDIPLIGGIAIKSEFQGMGLFKKFFHHVLTHYAHTPFMILWSEKEQLFKHFDFYPMGVVFEYLITEEKNCFAKKVVPMERHINEVMNIFEQDKAWRSTFKRTLRDWKIFSHITSSNLTLFYRGENPIGYTMTGKGQDLTNIIHEYACLPHYKNDFLQSLPKSSLLWTTEKLPLNLNRILSMGLVKINQNLEITPPLWISGLESV